MTQRRFETVAQSGPYRVDHLAGGADTLVIAFSSIGHDPAQPPSPEFVASATAGGRPALFVIDQARSWTNAPGFDRVLQDAVAVVHRRQPLRRILTIGQSMGGFAALVAADVLPVDAVLAFGPQSRIDDPADTRWSDWTAAITPLHRATPPLPEAPWLCLFHGMRDDARQADRFPQRRGLDHLLFPDHGHSGLTAHLKRLGLLQALVDAAALGDRRRLIRLATGAGGRRRPVQLPR